MSAAFWDRFPSVFSMATATPLGIVALALCLLASLVGLFLLIKKPSAPSTLVIVLLILGTAALVVAVFRLLWAQLSR